MNLVPKSNYIVVKPINRTKSYIIDVIMQENDNLGIVYAVGPGKMDKKGRVLKPDTKVGDIIRFGTMGRDKKEEYLNYKEYIENSERYLIMTDADICFVVGEENAIEEISNEASV